MLNLPNTFGTLTGIVPLSYFDANFLDLQKMWVSSIAELRTVSKTGCGVVYALGYTTIGDGGGGGVYWYNAADTTSTDNGGSIIVANDGGRWYLIPAGGYVRARQFGAKGDNATDDTIALQNLVTFCQLGTNQSVYSWLSPYLGPVEAYIDPGEYICSGTISIGATVRLRGPAPAEFSSGARIKKTTSGDLFNITPPSAGMSVGFRDMTLWSSVVGTGHLVNMNWTTGPGCNSNRFENMVFAQPQQFAVVVTGDDTSFTNCVVDVSAAGAGNAYAIGTSTATYGMASNCRFVNCNWFSVLNTCVFAYQYRGLTITGGQVTQSGGSVTSTFFDAGSAAPGVGLANGATITGMSLQDVQKLAYIGTNSTGTVLTANRGRNVAAQVTDWITDQSVDAIINGCGLSGSYSGHYFYNGLGVTVQTLFENNQCIDSSSSTKPINLNAVSSGTFRDNLYVGFTSACLGGKFATSGAPFAPTSPIVATSATTITYTVAGASPGDIVTLGAGSAWPLGGTLYTQAYVSAANTVSIRYVNATAASIAVAAHDWNIEVKR